MNNNNTNQNGAYYVPPVQNQPVQQAYQPPAQHAPYVYQPYIPVKKTYKPFEKRDTRFIALALLTAFLLIDFALFHGFNIGFTIAYFALFAVTTAYTLKKDAVKNAFSLACGALSLAGAVTFTLFDNKIINSIMFFLVFGLYGFYVLGISDTFRRPRGSFKSLFDLFDSVVVDTFGGLEYVFGSAKATSKNKRFINSLIGIGIAIPFLIVIIPLLVQSDAAFEALVKKIAKDIGIYLVELGLAIVATPFLFSYFYSKKREKTDGAQKKDKTRVIPTTVSISFLSAISVTYLVYLFSQLAYFFSAFRGILPEDYHYTASAFARRGFYEMAAICAINVAIISLVGILTKRAKGKVSPMIKALSMFISLFSVLLIVISMQKMKLNISIYGLTANRVLVSTLMIMLFIMIAFFILHIFLPKISYFQPIIIICSVMFIALSFANIDALCANYNISAYQSGKIEMLDTNSIRNSSDSAIPYLIDLANGEDKVSANSAKNQLAIYICRNDDLKLKDKNTTVKINSDTKDFRRYNRARNTAYNGVKQYYESLSKEERKPMQELVELYKNGYYDEEENCFIEFTDEDYSIKHSYNRETGLYDKTEKTREW